MILCIGRVDFLKKVQIWFCFVFYWPVLILGRYNLSLWVWLWSITVGKILTKKWCNKKACNFWRFLKFSPQASKYSMGPTSIRILISKNYWFHSLLFRYYPIVIYLVMRKDGLRARSCGIYHVIFEKNKIRNICEFFMH